MPRLLRIFAPQLVAQIPDAVLESVEVATLASPYVQAMLPGTANSWARALASGGLWYAYTLLLDSLAPKA